jgi:hypothetical protein
MPLRASRRFGLVSWVAWLLGASLLFAYEWSAREPGVFVYRMPLAGSTFDVARNEVTLPGGQVVPLKQQLSELRPWEVDWNQEPEAAPLLAPNWQRLLRLGLLLPATLWVLVEIIAWLTRRLRRERAA